MTGAAPPRSRPVRSTAHVVLSRADVESPQALPTSPSPPVRRWPLVLTWVLLGSAIAGAWTLLLIGDSLHRLSG